MPALVHTDSSEPPTSPPGDPGSPPPHALITIREAEAMRAERWHRHSQYLDALWGPEPPYTHQEEDDSSWIMGALFYTWIGDFMFRAAREELTMESMPTPTRERRAYATGVRFSQSVQRQRQREHNWDNYVGLRVEYRGQSEGCARRAWHGLLRLIARRSQAHSSPVPVGATGTLRWVGTVQQFRAGRQRYAGVEWDFRRKATPHSMDGADEADGVTLLSVETTTRHLPTPSQTLYHNGTLNGEVLFTTSDGQASATCEPVESIVFVNDGSCAALPEAMEAAPRGLSMATALFGALGMELLMALPIRLVRDTCTVSVPLVLKVFIDYIVRTSESPDTAWGTGWALVLTFFVFSVTQCVSMNKYFHLVDRAAFVYRSSLCAIVFEKCMTISGRAMAHPTLNPGRIVNMVSTDATKVQGFTMWAWASLGATAQLFCGIGILYYLVGWPAFVGLAVLIIPLPLQWRLTQWLFDAFDEKAVITDQRLKATNEFLSGIRVVKYMSWEPSFIVKIEELRRREVAKLRKIQNLFALTSLCNTAVPSLVVAVVFVVFTYTGNTLTPSIIFPVISLISVLQMPFDCIPLVASAFTQFIVSMRRIARFVECDDTESQVVELTEALERETATLAAERARPGEEEAVVAMMAHCAARFHHATVSATVPLKTLYPEFAEAACAAVDVAAATPLAADKPAAGDDNEDDDETAYYQLRAVELLKNIDLRIPRGKLTVIVGPTGCGKSTLLDTLIGALDVTRGEVAATRSIAYVPQQPWIMNATLRDNVLFFGDVDAARFDAAVSASQLRADLALLADGLDTEIGERGINLSGGQKARVSLARAVYADKELYLLDDPLSALDAHVGERVMHECILGALAGKTRVLATHQVHFAREADYVVELSAGGRVVFWGDAAAYAVHLDACEELPTETAATQEDTAEVEGTYDDTLKPPVDECPDDGGLVTAEEHVDDVDALTDRLSVHSGSHAGSTTMTAHTTKSRTSGKGKAAAAADGADSAAKAKLIEDEEKAEGSVPLAVYLRYARACGGVSSWVLIFILHLVTEVLAVSSSVWLAFMPADDGSTGSGSSSYFLGVFLLLLALGVTGNPIRRFFTSVLLRRASRNLHSELLRSVSIGTMMFFDVNPLGRVLNRFSKDVTALDETLADDSIMMLEFSFLTISSLCVMILTQPFILLLMAPLGYGYYRISLFFNAANRTVRRLANLTNAPVLALLNTVISGRWTVEAYQNAHFMLSEARTRLDRVFSTYYMQSLVDRWLAVRIGLLSNLLVTAVAFFGVWTINRKSADVLASSWHDTQVRMIPLSMTMAMKITMLLNELINNIAFVEADMNSIERLVYYIDEVDHEPLEKGVNDAIAAHGAKIQEELAREAHLLEAAASSTAPTAESTAVLVASPTTPSTAAPAVIECEPGSLEFRHVDMRYREGLPLVLRDVSFVIERGQKVGVVGRTGSGKSTLLLAFLRLVEVCGGSIVVNGRDASDYELRELRLLFSMIPQDPLLFDGTVRSNVDPFGECSDGAVWDALRHVGMSERVRGEAGGLDCRVQEGGSNFSVGQRQLLCLARALLKRGSAFLLMDEATANVDPALDRQIQQTVHDVFAAYTVVTIAHRLHTVARYDVIIVMDGGRVLEVGSPRELALRADSHFAGLVRSMGAAAQTKFMESLA